MVSVPFEPPETSLHETSLHETSLHDTSRHENSKHVVDKPSVSSSTALSSEAGAKLISPIVLSDARTTGSFFTIDGMSMHVVDEGPKDAPVLICLHGNPTWGFYFRNILLNFKNEYRVIIPDHIGMGMSEKYEDKTFKAADRVGHLRKLLQQLNVSKFSLLMHDWGGPIGARLASELSSQVDKLIFLNTTLTEVKALPSFIRLASGTALGKFFTQSTSGFLKTMIWFGSKTKLSKEAVANYLFPYKSSRDRKAIYDFVADIPLTPGHPSADDAAVLEKQLVSLSAKPTLLLWGLKDPCFHTGILRSVKRQFPNSEVVEFADASHLVLEDRPAECITRIYQFLKS